MDEAREASEDVSWIDEQGRTHVHRISRPGLHEHHEEMMAVPLHYPVELIRSADAVLRELLPVAAKPKAALQLLTDRLQRAEVPDALELAVALVALQRLAHRYVTEVPQ